jgi:hypothetical protein
MNGLHGILVGLGLAFIISVASSAQTTVLSIQALRSAAAGDLEVMLQAVESTEPVPADSIPRGGTFWSAQHINYPPLPANIHQLPAWDLGGGNWLLADLDFDYAAEAQQNAVLRQLARGLGSNMDSQEFAGSGCTFDTNSPWLEITNVAYGMAGLNLHNATNGVYAIWSATNLLAGWQVETEVWRDTNQTKTFFALPTLDRPNLFLRAEDWTGVDSDGDGIPNWWIWGYFGNLSVMATNLDQEGNTLLYDYTNGLDPNVIAFTLWATNAYFDQTAAPIHINVSAGVPAYKAVLVNDTNFAGANWQPYNSNGIVSLNSGDGIYDVWTGLKGLPPNAHQTWQSFRLTLDTVPPVLTVTNPTSTAVSQPMIQVQGYADEALSRLTFDVSNAAGIQTNLTSYITRRYYDLNRLDFTTNWFQCYDIVLASGLNIVTLHAADLAGNVTTTHFIFTLDYSGDTTPPALTMIWPQDGTAIGGSSFTLRAQVDDNTATVTARIVDAGGNTNTVPGLVERSGRVWVQNLPLAAGTNTLTLFAADAAGNTAEIDLALVQSAVTVSMNPLSGDQQNQWYITVTGTVSDPSCAVTVNGVQATVNSNGTWVADGVLASPVGVASFDVEAYAGGVSSLVASRRSNALMRANNAETGNLLASQMLVQLQQATVVASDFSGIGYYAWKDKDAWDQTNGVMNETLIWDYQSGGTWNVWGNLWVVNDQETNHWFLDGYADVPSFEEGTNNYFFTPTFEYATLIDTNYQRIVQTRVMIVPQGMVAVATGQTNTTRTTKTYLVRACAASFSQRVDPARNYFANCPHDDFFNIVTGGVWDQQWYAGDVPLPPEWFQINGQTLINTGQVNDDGSIWGATAVKAPDGVPVDVTPTFTFGVQSTGMDYTFLVKAADIALVADVNRDGQINLDGSDNTASGRPFRFWVNDDRDDGDVASSGSDEPGQTSNPNYADAQVNGRCDLIDFFPVALCLSNVLQQFSPTDGYEYHLSQANGAVNFVYTDLGRANAFDYLTNLDNSTYGSSFNQQVWAADAIQVTASPGVTLSADFLNRVVTDGNKGVVLVEGRAVTTEPLMLEVWRNYQKLADVSIPLSINGVEQMYRWVNLRDSFTVSGETQPIISFPSRGGQPANFPDSGSNRRQVIYVHGYNVNEQQSRAEIAEAFKRLWQSRSKAMFTGVSWYGNQEQLFNKVSLDYHINVRNAFLTATELASGVASLPGTHKVVIAHSLGNMVVSSAIADWGMNVEKYCAIDAAVAMEAYDGMIQESDMINPDAFYTFQGWKNYGQRLWPTEWYKLFDANDGRYCLTWRNRFNAIPNLYNFYSSGEQILRNSPSDLIAQGSYPPIGEEYIWVTQEMRKGTDLLDVLSIISQFFSVYQSTPQAGWGLNADWYIPSDPAHPGSNLRPRYPWEATTNEISDDALRANSFFRSFRDGTLYDSLNGSAEATNIQIRAEALGTAIPALSHAAGANEVPVLDSPGQAHNFSLSPAGDDPGFEADWPQQRLDDDKLRNRWLHSDLKDVAYPFNHKLHDKLVELGGLNEN